MDRRGLLRVAGAVAVCAAVLFALYRISLIPITLPEEGSYTSGTATGLQLAVHVLLARTPSQGNDLGVDYASAYSLTHRGNAYAHTSELVRDLHTSLAMPIPFANPHPPTALPFVLPITLFTFARAAQLWAFAMVLTYIATIALFAVRWPLAVALGIGLAITLPGADGLTNVTPIIGFGVALAYRYRDEPWLAGLGMAVAAAPKWSGLVLLLPFLLSGRLKAVLWAAGMYGLLAAIPMALQHDVWTRYLADGLHGVAVSQARPDNGAMVHQLAQHWQVPTLMILAVLAGAAVFLALASGNTFWPVVWLMVAALPIAWMYSLLTLLPIGVYVVTRRGTGLASALVITAAGLVLGTPGGGLWPVGVIPIVLGLMFVAVLAARGDAPEFSFGRLRVARRAALRPAEASD
ncbi:MAG: DUF2029 domain-containing protein [Candidatus Dormibacteraeota bacterium]|nr:DUF2029 domain-containing protein [Candidatus Dormibacteraeota bacterium]